MTTADQIEEKEVSWLFPGWLPKGYVGLLEGDPGVGKSTLAACFVARLTQHGHKVIYLAGEDGIAEQLVPRFKRHGVLMDRVVVRMDGYGDNEGPILPTDAHVLRQAIVAHSASLVVIDNIDHFADKFSTKAGASKLMQVAGEIARETGCSILFLRHLNKSKGKSAQYRGAGSIGIFGGARFVWLLAFKPGTQKPLLVCTKMTVAPQPNALLWEWEDGRLCLAGEVIADADKVLAGETQIKSTVKKVKTVASTVRDVKTIMSLVKTVGKVFK